MFFSFKTHDPLYQFVRLDLLLWWVHYIDSHSSRILTLISLHSSRHISINFGDCFGGDIQRRLLNRQQLSATRISEQFSDFTTRSVIGRGSVDVFDEIEVRWQTVPGKHNRLSIKHFVVAPYSSHDLFCTRDSQMLYLQSIPDSEEDQPAVVSSSEFCVTAVLNSLPSRRSSSTKSSAASLGIRSVHRKFMLLPMALGVC